jgi:hypothetical protein
MVPVIRVDMEAPLIGGYAVAGLWGVAKNLKRAGEAMVGGMSMKQLAAKSRLMDTIKEAQTHFGTLNEAGIVQAGLNPVMAQFQTLFGLYGVSDITPYDTTRAVHGYYISDVSAVLEELLGKTLGFISQLNTGKSESPIIPILVINYKKFIIALAKVQPIIMGQQFAAHRVMVDNGQGLGFAYVYRY